MVTPRWRKGPGKKKQMPEVLIITPESLHLLLAQKNYPNLFSSLKMIAVDEWHELLGSKRGVQVELAIARLVGSREMGVRSQDSELMTNYTRLRIWGISATIGNLEEAKEVLLAPLSARREVGGEANQAGIIIKANLQKK